VVKGTAELPCPGVDDGRGARLPGRAAVRPGSLDHRRLKEERLPHGREVVRRKTGLRLRQVRKRQFPHIYDLLRLAIEPGPLNCEANKRRSSSDGAPGLGRFARWRRRASSLTCEIRWQCLPGGLFYFSAKVQHCCTRTIANLSHYRMIEAGRLVDQRGYLARPGTSLTGGVCRAANRWISHVPGKISSAHVRMARPGRVPIRSGGCLCLAPSLGPLRHLSLNHAGRLSPCSVHRRQL
jgi:hypothetical protein